MRWPWMRLLGITLSRLEACALTGENVRSHGLGYRVRGVTREYLAYDAMGLPTKQKVTVLLERGPREG